MYIPEQWSVIEFSDGMRKVFGGWRGGYITGDNWQLNSGIVNTEETPEYYDFHGASGSVYRCSKNAQGINSPWLASVLGNIMERGNAKIINYGETNED
jgi:hypothetical protein